MTEYLPDEITYGFVADRVLLAVGDTTGDDDRFPDGVPAKGTVKFSPERTILYTQDTPATVLPQDIECTIYHRDHPVAVNNGYEPELVGKLVDPAGHVGNVALIVGWYEAVYRLETGPAHRFRFKVKPEHTNESPLWLPSVAPLTPTPSERFVVNEQVYNDTLAARDKTVEYRDAAKTHATAAQTARTGAETAETNAGTHATAAATSASTAADILAANQALGITVDTSVGTRVFVGDTMIHGDTGWRDITGLLDESWSAEGSFRHLELRRENSTVYLRGWLGNTLDTENSHLLNLPDGFRPGRYGVMGHTRPSGASSGIALANNSPSSVDLIPGATPGTSTFMIAVNLSTHNDWPTSLPGTPA